LYGKAVSSSGESKYKAKLTSKVVDTIWASEDPYFKTCGKYIAHGQ
jgi:hypothetical protein